MPKLNMKRNLIRLVACLLLGVLAGCGKPAEEQPLLPDPATQAEEQEVLFQRTCNRVSGLIASKDYDQARSTIALLKGSKLTEQQKKVVDQLEAQIPKSK